MGTAKLDEIVRHKDPELKPVVDDLAHGRVREAVSELDRQGQVHEIPDRNQRFEAIARDYADSSGRTLVVTPDNRSRREFNDHIRQELKDRGVVGREDHQATVLVPRQDMREGLDVYTDNSQQLTTSPRASARQDDGCKRQGYTSRQETESATKREVQLLRPVKPKSKGRPRVRFRQVKNWVTVGKVSPSGPKLLICPAVIVESHLHGAKRREG
jgi:hypothetical protein